MPKRVLLFYPKIGRSIQREGNFEPLSLLSLARVLLPKGYSIEIIDSRIEDNFEERLKKIGNDFLCVGISCRSDQILDGLKFAEYIKKRFLGVPIVWGGWHPTTFCQQTIENQFVDIVVRGQGEATFLELVESFDGSFPFQNILGISYKENGSIINNPDRPLSDPMNFPPIPYDLLDVSRYLLGQGTLYYISSIGCPHRCGYCSIQLMYKRKWFGLKAQRVIHEIKNLYSRYSFQHIIFFDDDFFINKRRVAEICNGLIEEKVKATWSTHARVDEIARLDDYFLNLLKQSGCKEIFLGVETASQRMLDIIKKDCKSEDILKAVTKLNNYGIQLTTNFMIGLPDENKEDFQITLEIIKKIIDIQKGVKLYLPQFVPVPGTYLYNTLHKTGEIEQPENLEEWGLMFLNMDSATKPWLYKNDKIGRPIKSFYLWLGFVYLEVNSLFRPVFIVLRTIARFRFRNNFFFFPLEWWFYKELHRIRKAYRDQYAGFRMKNIKEYRNSFFN